jgi:hypothetical protein
VKIYLVGAEYSQGDTQHTTKVIVAFRNLANAPNYVVAENSQMTDEMRLSENKE